MVAVPSDLSWLPPLFGLQECGGDWTAYSERLYCAFRDDFVHSVPSYGGKRVAVQGQPYPDGRHQVFWHLTSQGEVEADRDMDLRRCERLRWVRALIDKGNAGSDLVCCWTDRSRGDLRHQIALPDFSYLVVLADKGNFNLLITAFCIEREHTQKKHRQHYEASKVPARPATNLPRKG